MVQDAGTDPVKKTTAGSSGLRLFGRRPTLQSPSEALQPEMAPPPPVGPPPSKRRQGLSAFSGFLTFLLLLAVGAVAGLAYLQQSLNTPGPLQSDKVVVIARGTDGAEIVTQLESEGVIDNSLLLNAALVLEGNRSKVRAGEYLFRKNASLRDVIDTLVSGKEILHSISIPEGLTSEQIVQRLRDNEFLTGDINDMPKEGTLLPDTFRVSRGMARGDLIRKMQEEQKRVLEQIWARRLPDLPVRSPYELVTLASIVEKETGKADERPRVAGVFINRLNRRMKLQSDPTIVYGLVGGRGTLGRGILRSEVDKPTPYNTYIIEGLPPGPIANPGRAALDAVARPSRTKEVFFVADGTGGHAFAETLDQHNRNVIRWRQLEKDVKDRQQQAPSAGPVDRVPPDAAPVVTPAPRDQRGEADLPRGGVFGALQNPFNDFATPAAKTAPTSAGQSARPKATPLPAPVPAQAANAPPAKTAPLTNFSLGAQLDERLVANLAAPVPGRSNALDGPDEPDAGLGDPTAVPVSAQRRADQKARAARYGVSAGSDTLPALALAEQEPAVEQPMPAQALPKVIKIYDASEGTALDPLKDKSWDLNSAKTLPAMKPEPRAVAGSGARAAVKPGARDK